MNNEISIIQEILIRLGLPSPKLFKKIKTIFIITGIIFASITAFNQSLPNTKVTEVLKIIGFIGTSLSTGLAFAAGITVENKDQLNEKIEEVKNK